MAEEAAKEEGAAEGEAAPKAKKFTTFHILLAAQTLVLLVAGGVIVKVAMTPKKVDMRESTLKERVIASVHDDLANIQFIEMPDVTVNLPQKHTLRTKIQIEVSNAEIAELIQKRTPAIRARIIDVLGQQSAQDAAGIQGKLLIKDAIRDAINDVITPKEKEGKEKETVAKSKESKEEAPNGIVRDIYFMEFILL